MQSQPSCSFWQTERHSPPLIPMEDEEDVEITPSFYDEILDRPGDLTFLTAPFPSFGTKRKAGILTKIGLKLEDLQPTKVAMKKIHDNALSRISKLKSKLSVERDQFKDLQKLYNQNKFQIIEDELNTVSKEFC